MSRIDRPIHVVFEALVMPKDRLRVGTAWFLLAYVGQDPTLTPALVFASEQEL